MDIPTLQAIVLDHGSCQSKAGFGGEERPRAVFPSIIGRLKCCGFPHLKDYFVGEEAKAKRSILLLQCPIVQGLVSDWDNMERLWTHALYTELRIASEEHPILLTESPFNSPASREKTTLIMFETFNVPALCLAVSSVLPLIASGRTTGIVLECGHEATHSVPVSNGSPQLYASIRSGISGKLLTQELAALLEHRYSKGFLNSDTAAQIKEQLCFVAQSDQIPASDLLKTYELPDGNGVTVDWERYHVPEALFRPSNVGRETAAIQEILFKSINRCSISMRSDLCNSLIVSGGSTLFPGFAERVAKEMESCGQVRVIAPPEGLLTTWRGGSVLSSLPAFERMYVTKEEYEEVGPSLIHRKRL